MAPVIPFTRYRAVARRDLPLGVPHGDSDLLPIAAFLWLCSIGRLVSTLVHCEVFDIDATLSLLYVIGLPAYVLCARYTRVTPR